MNQKGVTLLLMILILLVMTVGSGAVAAQIASDVRSARNYLEATKAFYVAWSSIANGRSWMTSGARRGAVGPISIGLTNLEFLSDTLPAGDIRRGRRDFTFEILEPNGVNAIVGDGRIKAVGSYPGADRSATDLRSRKALQEVNLWRDIKAFAESVDPTTPPGYQPRNALDGSIGIAGSRWRAEFSNLQQWFYVDFGKFETLDGVTAECANNSIPAGGAFGESWEDASQTWVPLPTGGGTGEGVVDNSLNPATLTWDFAATPVTTRRIRLTLTPNSGFRANLITVNFFQGPLNIRRIGTVRAPGRFSVSTNFDPADFN